MDVRGNCADCTKAYCKKCKHFSSGYYSVPGMLGDYDVPTGKGRGCQAQKVDTPEGRVCGDNRKINAKNDCQMFKKHKRV